MVNLNLNITKPNDAWIFHRDEIHTTKDGVCNVYVLLDAFSGYCFKIEVFQDLPPTSSIIHFLEHAKSKAGCLPKKILISKKNPCVNELRSICNAYSIIMTECPPKELFPLLKPFIESFEAFKMGEDPEEYKPPSEIERHELEVFIPDAYDLCPCASGRKFKYCCQNIFTIISLAMCAAEIDDNLIKALEYMKEAEAIAGKTAEILCRYAVCWSFFDHKKYRKYLKEAYKVNPNHPRTNYILGIDAKEQGKYNQAIKHYQKAIEFYPQGDKFHLNEAYNNLGSVYFDIGKYEEAKHCWEKGLLLLPTDAMTRNNLVTLIYDNERLPSEIREISPFMLKHITEIII